MLSILIAAAQATPDEATELQAYQQESLTEESWEKLKVRIESAPQDVATFIKRRAGCNHFGGETGSGDPEREQQVPEDVTKLRCNEVEADERSLQRAYREQPKVLDLLKETRGGVPNVTLR